jgi:hypothetical protein
VEDNVPPTKHGVVWAMGHDQLISWLEAQRNTPIDPEAALTALSLPKSFLATSSPVGLLQLAEPEADTAAVPS